MKEVVCFIPARYHSQRLPGKPLLKINGVSIINRVYLQVKKCKLVNNIIVLTDDERIKTEVENIGGQVELVIDECLNGTERIVKYLKRNLQICDIVVNVQGDEPFINPLHIDDCIKNYFKEKFNITYDGAYNGAYNGTYDGAYDALNTQMKTNIDLKCTTLCHVLSKSELKNRNVGKLVMNKKNDIMYCSRNIIPASKNEEINYEATYYGHIGVFVFDKDYLLTEYLSENAQHQMNEDIEWLKIIEQGYRINVTIVDQAERGIDTADDYQYFLNKY